MSIRQSIVIMAHPSPQNQPNPAEHGIGFETLFAEAMFLANRLRSARLVRGKSGLSAGESSILQVLSQRGPQTVPQIARLRQTSRQNIQAVVNRLAPRGYIELRDNPAHRRSGLVGLTDTGTILLGTNSQRQEELVATLAPHISEAELASASRLLRKVRDLFVSDEKVSGNRSRRAGEAKGSPPGGEKKVSNQGNRSRKTAQRQEAITSTAETRTPERQVEIAEENEVADEGLPYNLL